jgi:hypothetical protein
MLAKKKKKKKNKGKKKQRRKKRHEHDRQLTAATASKRRWRRDCCSTGYSAHRVGIYRCVSNKHLIQNSAKSTKEKKKKKCALSSKTLVAEDRPEKDPNMRKRCKLHKLQVLLIHIMSYTHNVNIIVLVKIPISPHVRKDCVTCYTRLFSI